MLKYFYIIIIMFCTTAYTKHNYFYELELLQDENSRLKKDVKFLSKSLIQNSIIVQGLNRRYKYNLIQKDIVIKY